MKRRILIVDDNHGTRELLRRMLRHLTDAYLLTAADGATALTLFHQHKPQVTLLDIEMPGMDGFEVLQQIRAIDSEAFVVMVSAHSRLEAVQKAVQMGVGGYVVKPYNTRRLVESLNRYAEKSGDRDFLIRQD
jgi:two-component system chemotaxis response regulator CheY